jgi:hypothetical protein
MCSMDLAEQLTAADVLPWLLIAALPISFDQSRAGLPTSRPLKNAAHGRQPAIRGTPLIRSARQRGAVNVSVLRRKQIIHLSPRPRIVHALACV